MPSLAELREKKADAVGGLAKVFSDHPVLEKMPVDVASTIKGRNDEITAITLEIEKAEKDMIDAEAVRKGLDAHKRRGSDGPPDEDDEDDGEPAGARGGKRVRTFGDILAKSAEYKAFQDGDLRTVKFSLDEMEAKTLLTLANGPIPQPTRVGPVDYAVDVTMVSDLMLPGSVGTGSISYWEETTLTNGAAEVAEGEEKPESALGYTEVLESVRKIATWIPATTEALEDMPTLRSMVEGRLRFMVRQREEGQLLVGNGTAPNLSGITDRSGIQTQAKGVDSTPDAIYKAMTKIETNAFADPTALVIHPLDWQDIRLLKTGDGLYIWGSPAEAGPERIWGLPIRKTAKMTQNTALVGAFRPHAQIFRRTGIDILISTEHSDYVIKNKVLILAEERLALAVYRPAAFCTVTGV